MKVFINFYVRERKEAPMSGFSPMAVLAVLLPVSALVSIAGALLHITTLEFCEMLGAVRRGEWALAPVEPDQPTPRKTF